MSYVKRDLLREAKRNALKANLNRVGRNQVAPAPLVHMDRDGKWVPPPPSVFLDHLRSRGEQHDSACRRQNRETFSRLYDLGMRFDDVLTKQPSPADHLRLFNYRPRKKSTLSREVAPEEVVVVEYVDGWSLRAEETDETEEERTPDEVEESGEETGEEEGQEGQWYNDGDGQDGPNVASKSVLEDGRVPVPTPPVLPAPPVDPINPVLPVPPPQKPGNKPGPAGTEALKSHSERVRSLIKVEERDLIPARIMMRLDSGMEHDEIRLATKWIVEKFVVYQTELLGLKASESFKLFKRGITDAANEAHRKQQGKGQYPQGRAEECWALGATRLHTISAEGEGERPRRASGHARPTKPGARENPAGGGPRVGQTSARGTRTLGSLSLSASDRFLQVQDRA
ncbi:hypothetical protein MAPG_04740 [Magnaporthiopsis poae ATCC 64411]|uniref:Uncharacterized protein n=1 Tax=Magnaporthiopsis poae (strain ATCC 64411 / 73-15) TaxID=644358 RepID=A0A0C4DXI7_MAGP6|nr:hypothetical protein MAPG_04740 [Magnaporthiopsis poae ATCC 64411]